MRVNLQVGQKMDQDGARYAPKGPSWLNLAAKWGNMSTKRPKLAQVGRQMGLDGHQEGAREAQVGHKMVQDGAGRRQDGHQEGTREARVGPKSGQKKRDPKFNDFWNTFGVCFRGFFVLQAVF